MAQRWESMRPENGAARVLNASGPKRSLWTKGPRVTLTRSGASSAYEFSIFGFRFSVFPAMQNPKYKISNRRLWPACPFLPYDFRNALCFGIGCPRLAVAPCDLTHVALDSSRHGRRKKRGHG